MLKCAVKRRIVNDEGKLWGYMLYDLESKKEFKISGWDVIEGLNKGVLDIKDVIVTKKNTLRGTNGFYLSKVKTILLSDGRLLTNMRNSLQYVLTQMIGDEIDKRTHLGVEYVDDSIHMIVKTVIADYELMPEDKAKEELESSIEFYNKHKPNVVEGSVDHLEGRIIKHGLIEIKAIKDLK